MIATSVVLSGGISGINQFFGVGPGGFGRGFRTVPEAEVTP
jgi:hypothetical protein